MARRSWQFRGKDTGYPAVNVVDERSGGYDGMMRLMERTRSPNTTLSLSDNYDDAYRSNPAWNEEMIARKPDGELWKSREWTGEESYIQGLAKYMEGPGVERVQNTCERYRLPGTIHVDVLSYFAIRNDWDAKHPASGIRNLYAGRYPGKRVMAIVCASPCRGRGTAGSRSRAPTGMPPALSHFDQRGIPLSRIGIG